MTDLKTISKPSTALTSIVNERTPCLFGQVGERNTLYSKSEMPSGSANTHTGTGIIMNWRSKNKFLGVALVGVTILVILSTHTLGVSFSRNTTRIDDSYPHSLSWERQKEIQSSAQNIVPQITNPSGLFENEHMAFDDFLVKFNKSYESKTDHDYRKTIYESNLEQIQSHNEHAEQHGWFMGINKFADMHPHEVHTGLDKRGLPTRMAQLHYTNENNHNDAFASLLGNTNHYNNQQQQNLRQSPTIRERQQFERNLSPATLSLEDLPTSVDWRTHDPPIVTPIKDQGHCGSCWAFAATAVLESHAALATKELFVLSPQELVSCAPNPNHCGGDGGCTGSTGELAYEYVAEHGMVTEWEYGYTSYRGTTGTCELKDFSHYGHNYHNRKGFLATKHSLVGAKVGLVGYSSLPTNSYEALMHAVATLGPVVVSVAASGWGLYKGGVFDDFDTAEHYDINHAVVLEGYGTDEETGQDFWLVRNSWGVMWGEDGYIRLKREKPSEDDTSHCKMDVTPSHGVACGGPDNNATIPDELVCGTSGILYANVVPVGAYLI